MRRQMYGSILFNEQHIITVYYLFICFRIIELEYLFLQVTDENSKCVIP